MMNGHTVRLQEVLKSASTTFTVDFGCLAVAALIHKVWLIGRLNIPTLTDIPSARELNTN